MEIYESWKKEPDVVTDLIYFLIIRLLNGVFVRIPHVISKAKQVQ
jgi:hypothetical protein